MCIHRAFLLDVFKFIHSHLKLDHRSILCCFLPKAPSLLITFIPTFLGLHCSLSHAPPEACSLPMATSTSSSLSLALKAPCEAAYSNFMDSRSALNGLRLIPNDHTCSCLFFLLPAASQRPSYRRSSLMTFAQQLPRRCSRRDIPGCLCPSTLVFGTTSRPPDRTVTVAFRHPGRACSGAK